MARVLTRSAFLAAALALLAGAALGQMRATPPVWNTVGSAEGGYMAELPGKPVERRIDTKASSGQVLTTLLQEVSLENGTLYFAVLWTPVATPPTDKAAIQKYLFAVRDRTAAALKGSVITTKTIERGRHQGIDYIVESPGSAIRHRYVVLLVGSKIVQQAYSGPTGSENSPDVKKFHASLKLRQ